MTRFLVFTMFAPMVAYGEIAVGERRTGWDRPGRSAILGLVAGALGVVRTDEAAHADLDACLGLALRMEGGDRPFTDYHTVQTPSGKREFLTRTQELRHGRIETLVSKRSYRSGSLVTAALWQRGAALYSLEDIRDALVRPVFAPFAGRRSCPFALPLGPRIIEAETIVEVLEPDDRLAALGVEVGRAPWIAADTDAPGLPADAERRFRRDGYGNRSRWQFSDREEIVFGLGAQR